MSGSSSGRPPATTKRARIVVVGDALLDRDILGRVERVCPDAPVPVIEEERTVSRPGGAALAAALAAERAGDAGHVLLVTALGSDDAGRELRQLVDKAGVEVVDLGSLGPTPEKIRLRSGDQSIARIDRNPQRGNARVTGVSAQARAAISDAGAVLVADYGAGLAGHSELRQLLAGSRTPLVWDPHRLGPAPVPGTLMVTPNKAELLAAAGGNSAATSAASVRELAATARHAMRAWQARGVAVTLGHDGALFVDGDGPPMLVPVAVKATADTRGAGDCFSAAAALALAQGAVPSEAVAFGVEQACAYVSGGGGAAWGNPGRGGSPLSIVDVRDRSSSAWELAAAMRAAGGTVVCAGGCFDVLHEGHVKLLQAARRLGDCLVVCVNSDTSVRRLKGAGRPVVPEQDRVAVLRALTCVDAVVVFEERTPEQALRGLKPHIFAKGGDYANRSLPEQQVMDEWQGQCVVLPYVDGHSTTGFLQQARWP
jgi:D-beta-D-heptose 7-phosphate kinase/D-beta-D-heptose 1-phosphate adenosyltransferase